MPLSDQINHLNSSPYAIINQAELEELLNRAEILEQCDTQICGLLRIIKYEGILLIQESSNQGEIILRRVETLPQAHNFIAERMKTYEKMWDGCGCKIDYYSA